MVTPGSFETERNGIAAIHRGEVARLAVDAAEHIERAYELRFLPLRYRRAAPGEGERAALHPEAHGARRHHLLGAALERHLHRYLEIHLLAPGLGARGERQRGDESAGGKRVVEGRSE